MVFVLILQCHLRSPGRESRPALRPEEADLAPPPAASGRSSDLCSSLADIASTAPPAQSPPWDRDGADDSAGCFFKAGGLHSGGPGPAGCEDWPTASLGMPEAPQDDGDWLPSAKQVGRVGGGLRASLWVWVVGVRVAWVQEVVHEERAAAAISTAPRGCALMAPGCTSGQQCG